MREQPGQPDVPVALAATGTVGGPALTPADPPVALPLIGDKRRRRLPPLPRFDVQLGSRAGTAAVAALVLATFLIVWQAAAGPSVLVPRAGQLFPAWEAGPLHFVSHQLFGDPRTVGYWLSAMLLAMILAYAATLAAWRSLTMKTIAIAVVVLHVLLVLSPPMQLTDIFNYLGYARLGALHHLNPYTHTIRLEMFDPVYTFSSWHNLRSPYGPLFTALTYPLAFVPLPLAYWVIKIVTVGLSLGFITLVWQCARQLGRDPRLAVAFVAFNPIYLIYEVGAFHNDFFMLVPSMGAISLLLAKRDRGVGMVLMFGVAVKFTIVVLLPFLLLGARTRARIIEVIKGATGGAIVMAALSISLFGLTLPNLAQQSAVLTGTSVANVAGLILQFGGATPLFLKVCELGVLAVVAHQVLRNSDWVAGAGWATLALICSLGWLMPWYVVWMLPLAGLVVGARLRRAAVALTVYLILVFMPWSAIYMSDHNINLLNTPAGNAASSLQNKLAQ